MTSSIATQLLQRLAAGNADAIAELFAERIDWYVPGNPALPWVGRRSRRSEVAEYFRTMWPHFEPGKAASALDLIVVANEDAVIFARFTHTAASTKRSFETPVVLHLVVQDDQITKLHLYEDTWLVSNAFF
jgi:uncharacterized protein